MGRYQFPAYAPASTPRFIVLWTLHWEVIECHRLEPQSDLSGAMTAAMVRFEGEGWRPECDASYGFTFLARGAERVLLLITARDPASSAQQTFSPFRGRETAS